MDDRLSRKDNILRTVKPAFLRDVCSKRYMFSVFCRKPVMRTEENGCYCRTEKSVVGQVPPGLPLLEAANQTCRCEEVKSFY